MGITWTHLESVWNPSNPSEIPVYSTNQYIAGQELFFAVSYSKLALCSMYNKYEELFINNKRYIESGILPDYGSTLIIQIALENNSFTALTINFLDKFIKLFKFQQEIVLNAQVQAC